MLSCLKAVGSWQLAGRSLGQSKQWSAENSTSGFTAVTTVSHTARGNGDEHHEVGKLKVY